MYNILLYQFVSEWFLQDDCVLGLCYDYSSQLYWLLENGFGQNWCFFCFLFGNDLTAFGDFNLPLARACSRKAWKRSYQENFEWLTILQWYLLFGDLRRIVIECLPSLFIIKHAKWISNSNLFFQSTWEAEKVCRKYSKISLWKSIGRLHAKFSKLFLNYLGRRRRYIFSSFLVESLSERNFLKSNHWSK